MASLDLRGVVKRFGAVEVIHGVDLRDRGRRVRRLRRPVRLRKVDAAPDDRRAGGGLRRRDPSSTASRSTMFRPAKRGLAMVFQSYALYPHMSVRKNLSFGLETLRHAEGRDQAARRAGRRDPADRASCSSAGPASFPAASASASRSAAPSCASRSIFLFDEPLSNLDAELRVQMRVEINEAAPAARRDDDLRHPRPGRGDDAGRPHRRAARRRDRAGRHAARPLQPSGQSVRRRLHRLAADEFPRAAKSAASANGEMQFRGKSGLQLSLPVADVSAARRRGDGRHPAGASSHRRRRTKGMLAGEVQIAEHLGGETFLYVALPSGETLVVEIQGQGPRRPGERVGMAFDASTYHVFDAAGRALPVRREAGANAWVKGFASVGWKSVRNSVRRYGYSNAATFYVVIAGLDPATHSVSGRPRNCDRHGMDARVKPGHDDSECRRDESYRHKAPPLPSRPCGCGVLYFRSSTKIFPSPILPVYAAARIASIERSRSAVADRQLELQLRDVVDLVFGAAIDLGVALLAAIALHFGDRQAMDVLAPSARRGPRRAGAAG